MHNTTNCSSTQDFTSLRFSFYFQCTKENIYNIISFSGKLHKLTKFIIAWTLRIVVPLIASKFPRNFLSAAFTLILVIVSIVYLVIRSSSVFLLLFCFRDIVSSVNVGCKLNLKKIALHGSNVIYDRVQNAVFMEIRNPKTEAKIFSSGRVECRGAKTEEDSRLAARKYTRIIQKLGFNVRFIFSFL